MSETLDLCLDEINRSIESISTLYFKPPGIFHNAVVGNKEGQGYSNIITQLIRDCNPKEELSLFEISQKNGLPTRKDGRETIVDYLAERDINSKRNRRVGLPDSTPIVNVPKEFYLKRHDETLRIKRRKPNVVYFEAENSGDSNNSNVFRLLLSKFQDRETLGLLHALQNGSVTMESPIVKDSSESTRRRTIFLDDFPTESILRVLEEIAKQWPLTEYKQAFSKYMQEYNNINSELETIREELKLQEDQLQAQLRVNQSSSHVVTRLIEKEQNDIQQLELEIASLGGSLEE